MNAICQACFVAAVDRVARIHALPDDRRERLLTETRHLIATAPPEHGPPHIARELGPLLRRHLDTDDPFAANKIEANRHAAQVSGQLRQRIADAADPFAAAARIALAGNVIDFAYRGDQDLLTAVEKMAAAELGRNDIDQLRAELATAKRVLYLGDNTGEVWCDRLFIERFPAHVETIFATRDQPVLNDATLIEARAAGLHEVARVISSGSDAPGALPERLNAETLDLLQNADVVISKGQGNLEALWGRVARPVFFIFLVKCEHVVGVVGHPVGTGMVWRADPQT